MQKLKTKSAFTLVELLVVLAIIAILLVLIVPRVSGYLEDARQTAVQNDAQAVYDAAKLYVIDTQRKGATPAASISSAETNNPLAGYLDNVKEDDSYTLNLVYNESIKDYTITGSFTRSPYTVALPDLAITRSDGSEG